MPANRALPITEDKSSHDHASWLLIGVTFALLLAFQSADPFAFSRASITLPVLFWCVLFAAKQFYTNVRPNADLSATVSGLLQVLMFSTVGAALSYMVAAHGGSYWDVSFRAWDDALGLDWLTYLHWVNARPSLGSVFSAAYASLIPQMIVLVLALGFSGRLRDLRIAVFAAILTGLITVLSSGLMPGMSNYVARGLVAADFPNLQPSAAFVHFADLEALRAGTLRMIALDRLEGIITFPSYHAGLATVFAWGFLKAPYIRWPGFIWSLLILLATPIDGAHYFVDVFAEIVLAALSICTAHYCVGWRARKTWFSQLRRRKWVPATA